MPDLRLVHVKRVFGEDPPIVALDDVSISIVQGDFLAIEGPSGSGKSTLLNQIALIDRPSAGEYHLDTRAVSRLDEPTRARLRSDTFGFVFQSFHLVARRTARENVALGLLYRGVVRSERRRLAEAALHAVGLGDRAEVQVRKLSGGEQQRVAIARATLGGAAVLLADEPTGNLDSVTGAQILEQLVELNSRGTSVVLVTHDPRVAARATSRVKITDGRIVKSSEGPLPPRRGIEPPPGRASVLRVADALGEALSAIRSRPGRCSLLVASLAVAVALVVFTFGLSETASAQVTDRFDAQRNREVDIRVPQFDSDASSGIPADVNQRLEQVRGITSAGVYEVHDQVAVGIPEQPMIDLPLAGISPDLLSAVGATVRWAPGHPHRVGRREVLVGTAAASELNLGPIEINPALTIFGVPYGVAGVIDDGGRIPALAGQVAVDWREPAGPRAPTSWVYLTTVSGAAQQVARQAPIAIDPVRSELMEVDAPPDISTVRAGIQSDIRSALLALTAVAFLAALLGSASTMLFGVIERIGEFGLRRAIGARPIHVIGQTFAEGGIVGLIGGAVGLVIGLGAILIVTIDHGWTPVFDLRWLPLASAGGVFSGVLSGLPASLRAARIQPVDALRR